METKLCSIEGCNNKNAARGLCAKHYHRWSNTAVGGRSCLFEGCNRRHSTKGYCRKHYEILLRKGKVEYEKDKPKKKCDAPDCKNLVGHRRKYCAFHYVRWARGVPFDRTKGIAGKNNPRWNGGISQYKNHYEMKKIRKIILKKADYKCCYCGAKTKQIHHLDHSKDNHSKENLVACCQKCNLKMSPNFGKPKKTSKFKRLYGKTFHELKKEGFFKEKPELYPYQYALCFKIKERLSVGI